MKEKQKNLAEQLKEFAEGKYNSPDFKTQCEAGWYDWFCVDAALASKTKRLYSALKSFMKVVPVDTKKTYVFFKNNCPCWAGLYDDFRICDLKTGDVIWTVSPRYPKTKDEFVYSVWGSANNFVNAIFEGSRKEAFEFLKEKFGEK